MNFSLWNLVWSSLSKITTGMGKVVKITAPKNADLQIFATKLSQSRRAKLNEGFGKVPKEILVSTNNRQKE